MWKDRLSSRTLINLEAQILQAYRLEEDVPGWMIPQMYFDYLRDGDVEPMKSVFYHNAMDVLSMGALLNYLCQVLSEARPTIEMPGLDLIALAKFHEDFGDQRKAINLYQQVLNHIDFKGGTELSEIYTGVILRLANIYKRQEQISPAIQLWEKAASQNSIQACVELAMVYEHREKNYRKAIHWTEIGVELARNDLKDHGGEFWKGALEHRLTRLIRKLHPG